MTNGRGTRKRKMSMQDDFIYYENNERVNETKQRVSKFSRESLPKKAPKPSLQDSLNDIKPCFIKLQRIEIPKEVTSPIKDHLAVEENDIQNFPEENTLIEMENELTDEQQNENSTPNIPKIVSMSDEVDGKCDPKEDITEVFSSSASSVFNESFSTTDSTPIKSILSPNRSRDASSITKSVSFAEYNELYYYEPEKVQSAPAIVGNEIELEDLDDSFSEQSKPHETNEIQDEEVNQEEVNKVIDELISQQFEVQE